MGAGLSGAGIAQGKKKRARAGLAIAGVSCGAVGLVTSIIVLIAVYAAVSLLGTSGF